MDSFWIPVTSSVLSMLVGASASGVCRKLAVFSTANVLTNAIMCKAGVGIFCMVTSPVMVILYIAFVAMCERRKD